MYAFVECSKVQLCSSRLTSMSVIQGSPTYPSSAVYICTYLSQIGLPTLHPLDLVVLVSLVRVQDGAAIVELI